MSVLGRFCLAFATLLCGCDSLFGAFLGDNSRSCAVNPSICSAAQVCDPVLHQCQDITPGPRDGGMDLAHGGGDLGSACAGPGTCASGQWCSPLSNLCEKAPTLYSVSGNGSGTVWAVGDNGLVVVWDNSTTPVYLHSNTAVALRGVSAIAGTKQAWIVGDMGTILQATATQVMPATTFGTTTNSLRGVWTRSPQSAVAVGLTQATARYDANLDPNHLQTWTNVGGGPNADFFGIGGCDKPTPGVFPFLRALGANGQIFKWGGTSWNTSSEATMTVKQLLGTTCFAANDVWAVGVGLTILKIVHNALHAQTHTACRPHQNGHWIRSCQYTGAGDGGCQS